MRCRASGRALAILFSAMLLGRTIAVHDHTEVRVELQMDRWVARGGSVRLRCIHDIPPHLLDKVVFLRHGTKIFQYIRYRKPPYRNFTTPGAVLNIALATENSITLQNLDFAASGIYSCEVSLDTPIFTKASSEKQLTVFHPQKHHPRIDFPTLYLSSGETLQANCTTAPALPAPHITWFINGKKIDELLAHSHKFRVPISERSGLRGLQRNYGYDSMSTPPLVALTHASHVATRSPGCNVKGNQIAEMKEQEESNDTHPASRHKGRKPPRRDLYVTISELHIVATGKLEITCVSTIPEFRSIEDKFADVRNDTVIEARQSGHTVPDGKHSTILKQRRPPKELVFVAITPKWKPLVDVIRSPTYLQPSANITLADYNTSRSSPRLLYHSILYILIILQNIAS